MKQGSHLSLLGPMCELQALFLISEKEPVKIYRGMKGGKRGEDYFYKSSECVLNFAVE